MILSKARLIVLLVEIQEGTTMHGASRSKPHVSYPGVHEYICT